MSLVLAVGGIKSGKTHFCEELLAQYSRVGYFATAPTSWADEAKFHERIKAHQASRPATFETIEVGDNPEDLPELLRNFEGPVLVDSVGTWISALYEKNSGRGYQSHCRSFLDALDSRNGLSVIVSEEVGLSLHGANEISRDFVDKVGALNQEIAKIADSVFLIVAGRAVPLMKLEDLRESSRLGNL